MSKIPKGFYDPGHHLPWYLPIPDRTEKEPPRRHQITIMEALAADYGTPRPESPTPPISQRV